MYVHALCWLKCFGWLILYALTCCIFKVISLEHSFDFGGETIYDGKEKEKKKEKQGTKHYFKIQIWFKYMILSITVRMNDQSMMGYVMVHN